MWLLVNLKLAVTRTTLITLAFFFIRLGTILVCGNADGFTRHLVN